MATAVEAHLARCEDVGATRILGCAGFEIAAELLEPERFPLHAGYGGRALTASGRELLAFASQLVLDPPALGRCTFGIGRERSFSLCEVAFTLVHNGVALVQLALGLDRQGRPALRELALPPVG